MDKQQTFQQNQQQLQQQITKNEEEKKKLEIELKGLLLITANTLLKKRNPNFEVSEEFSISQLEELILKLEALSP